jgi:SNF2 family DNA or RNA helicase
MEEDIAFIQAERAEATRLRIGHDVEFRTPSPPRQQEEVEEAAHSDNEPEATNKNTNRRKRTLTGQGTGARAKKSRQSAAKRPAAPAKTANPRGKKKKNDHSLLNVTSLTGSNVFNDFDRNTARAEQPTFNNASSKADALKKLIASVPECARAKVRDDTKRINDATKSFYGVGSAKAGEDGLWTVKGMTTQLKAYQMLGVAFMRQRECSGEGARGGILADQMGLGMTLMMLANIVNGRPLASKEEHTTLIVASPALLKQWRSEIARHVEPQYNENKKLNKWGLGKIMEYSTLLETYHAKSGDPRAMVDLISESDIVVRCGKMRNLMCRTDRFHSLHPITKSPDRSHRLKLLHRSLQPNRNRLGGTTTTRRIRASFIA